MQTKPQKIAINPEEVENALEGYKSRKEELIQQVLMYSEQGVSKSQTDLVNKQRVVKTILEELFEIEIVMFHLNNLDYNLYDHIGLYTEMVKNAIKDLKFFKNSNKVKDDNKELHIITDKFVENIELFVNELNNYKL